MGVIRFLLALSVLGAHTGGIFGLTFVGGKIAVQTFFIISGFYMALILEKKYTGKGSYKLFITNRFLRIFPIYFVVLFLSIFLYYFLFLEKGIGPFHFFSDYFFRMNIFLQLYLILSQLSIFGLDWVMFLGVHAKNGLPFFTPDYLSTKPLLYDFLFVPQAWTLSLELLFYLFIPFVFRRMKLLMVLIFASISLRVVLYGMGLHHEPWTNRFFPTELVFFLLGVFICRTSEFIRLFVSHRYISIYFICFLLFFFFYQYIPYMFLLVDIKQFLFFLLLIGGLPGFFLFSQKNRLDYLFGELSYPMYLSHIFVFSFVTFFNTSQPQLHGIETAVITSIISFFLYFFIDRPIDTYRQWRVLQAKKNKKRIVP